jgi:D-tyrosyl-tRNA(Tyr) deacylase
MRVLVQRVREAEVVVDGESVGAIAQGLLLYVGVGKDDDEEDRKWCLEKVLGLRIFENEAGKMDKSVVDVGGSLLIVSQFTLYGDVRRGRRPSFDDAMPPAEANAAYLSFVSAARARGIKVATGRFAADMKVRSVNDGPVTIWIDSKTR